jgi:multicomponent Na+:H+ antiporter subunit E
VRAVRYGAFLVLVWLLLWDGITVGTLAAGIAVAAALLTAFPMGRGRDLVAAATRPTLAVRVATTVLSQLVRSNLRVTRQVLRRDSGAATAVVYAPLRSADPSVLTFVANVTALTPGTMPLEVESDPPGMHIHLLDRRDADDALRSIAVLEALAVRMLGTGPPESPPAPTGPAMHGDQP